MNKLIIVLITFFLTNLVIAQTNLPIRGFCIGAPSAKQLPAFVQFISNELAPRNVNTLVLRIDYNYQYQSHPELRDSDALSKKDMKQIVECCIKNSIRLIPQINLLGHQSWAENTHNLLRVYPQFDETPHIKMPEKYTWPNEHGLYCKSYCPQHPDLHKIIFELIDEICDVCEADAFHAGMDEVFYIGHDSCKRCSGRDKAELFANEVNLIYNHLKLKNRQLWIWGDRLIDGKTTGLGMWEASMNNTHRAVDLINKNVVICDWHYERADHTAAYFATKGFNVITCPWNNPDIAITQTRNMKMYRESSTFEMKNRFQGMMQTIWSGTNEFLNEFYDVTNTVKNTQSNCFRALVAEWAK